jgi:two-component system phosphate regulon sensor histidine kinase PhoR
MVVLHDVTPAKKAEQMRADFVSNVSHELRSPLASLLGFIETLRGPARNDPEAMDRFLGIMAGEGQRMTRLIDDLLVLSKVESDEHIRPEGSAEIGEILTNVARSLSLRSKERNVTINVEIKAPKLLVAGDKDQLTQVLHNLIDNAVSYGFEDSAVRVVVDAVPAIPSTGVAGLSVAIINRGEGIPQDDIPRLTERFYRVDKGRSRSMGGTGLGLAIVKHIVARHRGHLAIESVPGKETTFTVFLPRTEDETPPAALS